MNFENAEEKENKLLNRKEVSGTITFKGATPSNEELKTRLAEKYKARPETVVIRHIYTKFGHTTAEFSANIYKDVEQLKAVETKKNHPLKPEPKEGETPAEGAEAKPEKNKEEVSAEKKEGPKEEKVEKKGETLAENKEEPKEAKSTEKSEEKIEGKKE